MTIKMMTTTNNTQTYGGGAGGGATACECIRCGEGHSMVSGIHGGAWLCDLCNAEGGASDARWCCQDPSHTTTSCLDQIDFCYTCRPPPDSPPDSGEGKDDAKVEPPFQGERGRVTCAKGHIMAMGGHLGGAYAGKDWLCDSCDKPGSAGDARWCCQECQADFCYKCRPPQVGAETKTCCISYEDVPATLGLVCARDHFVSDDSFNQFVVAQNEGVVVNDLTVGRVLDRDVLQLAGRLDGSIKCPHKCDAPPYSDIDVARHVTESTFQGYLEVKMCVVERAVHDQAQTDLMAEIDRINGELGLHNVQISRERLQDQMKRQFPNAYQCGSCGFGPIDHTRCPNLATHHGEKGFRGQGDRSATRAPAASGFHPASRERVAGRSGTASSPRASTRLPTEVLRRSKCHA